MMAAALSLQAQAERRVHARILGIARALGSPNPPRLHMRQPPAERVRFILILKMLGPLLAWPGEQLGRHDRSAKRR